VQLIHVLCQIHTNTTKLHKWTPSLPVTEKNASFSLAHCDAVKVEEESIPLLLADCRSFVDKLLTGCC